MSTIGKMLDAQFSRMWKLLREVITKAPETLWGEGLRPLHEPSRVAYHIVETVDFYSGETAKNFPWGKKLSVDCWEAAVSELPSKSQVNKYTDEVREKTEAAFAEWSDPKFLGPQEVFLWTGETLLDRMIYALKHSYYHLGQINGTIRASGNEPAEWL